MSLDEWNDANLARMRSIGDPLADGAVDALFVAAGAGGAEKIRQLLRDLLAAERTDHGQHVLRRHFGEVSGEAIPEAAQRYFEEAHRLPEWTGRMRARDRIHEGGEFALEFGIMTATILACASLPECYVMKRGVEVLAFTGELDDRTHKRLMETAQFVMDAMTPGQLVPLGNREPDPEHLPIGIASALRVRLMHAAIRHLIQQQPEADAVEHHDSHPSADAYQKAEPNPPGEMPINQEDLAYTLMTFSYVPLRVMKQFMDIPDALADAFILRWNVIGHFMGLRPELLPGDLAEAEILFETIRRRQAGESEAGRHLTQHLLRYVTGLMPWGLKKLPRLLLYEYVGAGTARWLGVEPLNGFERFLTSCCSGLLRFSMSRLDSDYHADPALARKSAFVHKKLLEDLARMRPEGFRISAHFWNVEVFGRHEAVAS